MQCSCTRLSGSETCRGALLLGGDGSRNDARDGGGCTCNLPGGDRMCGGEGGDGGVGMGGVGMPKRIPIPDCGPVPC